MAMTLRDSRDDKVRRAGIKTRTGWKWEASATLTLAEGNLELKDIMHRKAMPWNDPLQ